MKLRPYQLQDLPRVSAVEALCFAPPFRFSQHTLRTLIEDRSSFTWVAEEHAQIAGFAIVQLEINERVLTGYLQTIDVAPAYRRRGVAGKLLECVESQIAQAGALVMRLHVSTQNHAAITMYEHRGYARMAIEERFYGSREGDAFLYEKPCQPRHS